jgi:hypothetical protein
MKTLDPERVLRSFFDDEGRLKSMPTKPAKLLIVLDRLAAAFVPGQRYPEKAVNELLLRVHPDYCTLRRSLVDSRRLNRDGGVYWRPETPAARPESERLD